ncbi:MAG: hypothetical protein QM628_17325 [Propionicimonas sp.]
MLSRREMVLEGIEQMKVATAKAVPLKSHADPDIRALAEAIHFLSYGAQEIGLALTDPSRVNDLPS